MWVIIAAAAAFLFLYWEVILPYVIFPLQARRHGCGPVKVVSDAPLGIPSTIKLLGFMRADRMVQMIAKQELGQDRTFWRESLFRWSIVTRDTENMKVMLATKFQDFPVTTRTSFMGPVFGSGIFTQDGAQWKHSRTMLRPQFTKEQIGRLGDLAHHANTLIDQIAKRGYRVEIQDMFHMLTMDTASGFLLGKSLESLKFSEYGSDAQVLDIKTGKYISSAQFVESYTYLNDLVLQKFVFNNMSIFAEWRYPKYRMHMKRAHAFIDHYVRQAVEAVEAGKCPQDNYVLSYELAKSTKDVVAIRDQIFNILIAGRDTTASTLSYSFYYFVRYPETWEKVKADVWAAFPNKDDSELTYEGLRRLRYVPNFVKEVLRLSPVVPLNLRNAARDTTLPRGGGSDQSKPVFVPKGTSINFSTYVLHRDPDIYGPTALEFDPERWLPENRIPESPMYSWGYLPFNGGPRMCLGQQFALTELYMTITKMAQVYDKVLPGANFPDDLYDRQALTSKVGGPGVPVHFVPYDS